MSHETADIRPYTVTGGRTRSSSVHLPLEALVETVDLRTGSAAPATPTTRTPPTTRMTPTTRTTSGPGGAEQRRILSLTEGRYLSIAELSAHLHLPLGVVRVLVGDLRSAGLVVVHGAEPATDAPATGRLAAGASARESGTAGGNAHPGASLSLLESVLDGISAL
jgi:hypothetical protein